MSIVISHIAGYFRHFAAFLDGHRTAAAFFKQCIQSKLWGILPAEKTA
jgi:hypothetical protein